LYYKFIRKLLVWLYVVVNIEKIISLNGLTGENFWTFGQIFSMANTFSMVAILFGYVRPSRVSWALHVLRKALTNGAAVIAAAVLIVLCPCAIMAFYLCSKIPYFRGSLDGLVPGNMGIDIAYSACGTVLWIVMVLLICGIIFAFRYLLWVTPLNFCSTCFAIAEACYESIIRPLAYSAFGEQQKHPDMREIEAIRTAMKSIPLGTIGRKR